MYRLALITLLWFVPLQSFAQVVDEEHSEVIDLSQSDLPIRRETLDLQQIPELMLSQVNSLRSQQDRSALKVNQQLTAAAQYLADYMAHHDKYGHTADNQRPANRAAQHGYDYCIVAENIAYQYSAQGFTEEKLAERFVTAWEHSPEHYKNMIDDDLMETGVAVARSRKTGYYYAVQMFGRPKSASIVFRIANQSSEVIEYEIGGHRLPLPPRYIRTHEECRPGEVIFHLPQEEQEQPRREAVQPRGGEQYVILSSQGEIEVQKK